MAENKYYWTHLQNRPRLESYFQHLKYRLEKELDEEVRDHLLDLWIEAATMAIDWDAEQWGLDPVKWMARERAQMDYREMRRRKTNS